MGPEDLFSASESLELCNESLCMRCDYDSLPVWFFPSRRVVFVAADVTQRYLLVNNIDHMIFFFTQKGYIYFIFLCVLLLLICPCCLLFVWVGDIEIN